MKFSSIGVLLVLLVAGCVMVHGLEGIVGQSQTIYAVNTDPVDPTYTTFQLIGNRQHGTLIMSSANPNTTCVPCPPPGCVERYGTPPKNETCGLNVYDITLMIDIRNEILSLRALVNNPSPYSFGLASEATVAGRWIHNKIYIKVYYLIITDHDAVPTGATLSHVGIDSTYSLDIASQVNVGQPNTYVVTSGFVGFLGTAWVSSFPTFPYQAVAMFQPIEVDANGRALTAANRINTPVARVFGLTGALAPYTPYVNTTAPVGALYVSGNASHVELGLDDHYIAADIYLHTTMKPQQGAFTGKSFTGHLSGLYEGSSFDPKALKVAIGKINNTTDGKTYIVANTHLVLSLSS